MEYLIAYLSAITKKWKILSRRIRTTEYWDFLSKEEVEKEIEENLKFDKDLHVNSCAHIVLKKVNKISKRKQYLIIDKNFKDRRIIYPPCYCYNVPFWTYEEARKKIKKLKEERKSFIIAETISFDIRVTLKE